MVIVFMHRSGVYTQVYLLLVDKIWWCISLYCCSLMVYMYLYLILPFGNFEISLQEMLYNRVNGISNEIGRMMKRCLASTSLSSVLVQLDLFIYSFHSLHLIISIPLHFSNQATTQHIGLLAFISDPLVCSYMS